MQTEFKTIGHTRIKEQLADALKSGRLGHAYLFSGEGGVGKFSMALDFALAYLCKNEEKKPCGVCESCRSALSYNNPRFQYLFPLKLEANLRKEDDLTQDGWEYVHERTLERIRDPYSIITDYFAPIYVGRIRNMTESIQNARGSKSATIIDGIDTLSEISLNTMLKTLEEPPAGALIILLSRFSVLATVRSRCIVYKFAAPTGEETINFLKSKAPLKNDEELSYIAQISQNNPGVALQKLSQDGENVKKLALTYANIVFSPQKQMLAKVLDLEKFAAGLGRDFDLAQQILVYFLSQIRAIFLDGAGFSSEKNVKIEAEMGVARQKNMDSEQAANVCTAIDEAILSIKRSSPLNMVFADLTIKLTGIFDERK